MGKSLIIKGANFAENAIERIGTWVTVFEGTITGNSPLRKTIDVGQIITAGTETRISVLEVTQSSPTPIYLGNVDVNNTEHDDVWVNEGSPSSFPYQSDSVACDYDFGKIRVYGKNTTSVSVKLEKYVYG